MFFCGLAVAGTKNKRVKKKKTFSKGSWMGYCPFACVESRYNGVYHDTVPDGAAQRATGA